MPMFFCKISQTYRLITFKFLCHHCCWYSLISGYIFLSCILKKRSYGPSFWPQGNVISSAILWSRRSFSELIAKVFGTDFMQNSMRHGPLVNKEKNRSKPTTLSRFVLERELKTILPLAKMTFKESFMNLMKIPLRKDIIQLTQGAEVPLHLELL